MVLVIGGTRGTGLLAARMLASRGLAVRVLARQPERAAHRVGPGIDVVRGDVTRAGTLPPAFDGATHAIYTAGIRSGRLAREASVKATDYQGTLNALTAARQAGLPGRFVYMTSIGGVTPSVPASLLNLIKGNVLTWRRMVEKEIRASGLDYTIVRAGFLLNGKGGRRALQLSQHDLPLALRYRIARADVAEACVESLAHAAVSRATFEIVWTKGERRETWNTMFSRLARQAPL